MRENKESRITFRCGNLMNQTMEKIMKKKKVSKGEVIRSAVVQFLESQPEFKKQERPLKTSTKPNSKRGASLIDVQQVHVNHMKVKIIENN